MMDILIQGRCSGRSGLRDDRRDPRPTLAPEMLFSEIITSDVSLPGSVHADAHVVAATSSIRANPSCATGIEPGLGREAQVFASGGVIEASPALDAMLDGVARVLGPGATFGHPLIRR
jgi:hypothetical protein